MSRKTWSLVIAIAAMILVNNLSVFSRSGLGNFMDVMLSLFIIYRAYVLYQKTNSPVRKPDETQSPTTTNPIGIVAMIFVIVFVLAAYQVVGAGSLNFFVWGDHILGNSHHPVIMWTLAGIFFGAAIGSLIIWQKYHIPFQWCLVTIVPFLLVLLLLQVLSAPLGSITPRPLVAGVADSARVTVADTTLLTPRRKKRHNKTTGQADTARQVVSTAAACAKQVAEVSINARADSVNVYYRTAAYQHGPWSAWKSKFVPQQGQFSLTEDGPVWANTLQYYYEARSVLTRSAQNPYTRALCDGQLVIDTY